MILLVALFFAIAAVLWWQWRKTSIVWLAYGHLSFLVLAGFILARQSYCSFHFSEFISLCTMVLGKLLLYGIPASVLAAVVLGYFLLPWIYTKKYSSFRLKHPMSRHAPEAGIYVVDEANPFAFTLKKKIFLSVGLCEMLTNEEMNAVVLHEMGHVKQNASFRNFTTNIMHFLSPATRLVTQKMLNKEEISADAFAISIQGTSRFLDSAREKLRKQTLSQHSS